MALTTSVLKQKFKIRCTLFQQYRESKNNPNFKHFMYLKDYQKDKNIQKVNQINEYIADERHNNGVKLSVLLIRI